MQNEDLQTTTNDGPSQEGVNDVVRQFVELLIAGGANIEMMRTAMSKSLANSATACSITTLTELGSIQRDCMKVMCAWRRDTDFVDSQGIPLPLHQRDGNDSFASLCRRVECVNQPSLVLSTLLDFGAISIDADNRIVPETPTFLLGRAEGGGRLAVDGIFRQLQGFLQVVHRNVCSVSGDKKPRFERACTVPVAVELEAIFDNLVRVRGQEFVDSIDEWLERNSKRESASGRFIELGVGVYFINLGEPNYHLQNG